MQKTKFIWHQGRLIPWDDAQIHVLSHTLHYGGGAFEGIRVYHTPKGPAIFKLQQHVERLFYSAASIKMELTQSKEELCSIIVELIKKNNLEQGYIRPIVYYGYGSLGVNPKDNPVELSIACWPWGRYLPEDGVHVKTSQYIRIHPKSTIADAKLCGHYLNGMLASFELRGTHYHEALLLDYLGYIAEGPGENFFIVKEGKLYTPSLGNILAGITRQTIFDIVKAHQIPVIEKQLTLEDAHTADEAFFCGTAAEISAILSIDDSKINGGPVTTLVRQEYHRIVSGEHPDFLDELSFC